MNYKLLEKAFKINSELVNNYYLQYNSLNILDNEKENINNFIEKNLLNDKSTQIFFDFFNTKINCINNISQNLILKNNFHFLTNNNEELEIIYKYINLTVYFVEEIKKQMPEIKFNSFMRRLSYLNPCEKDFENSNYHHKNSFFKTDLLLYFISTENLDIGPRYFFNFKNISFDKNNDLIAYIYEDLFFLDKYFKDKISPQVLNGFFHIILNKLSSLENDFERIIPILDISLELNKKISGNYKLYQNISYLQNNINEDLKQFINNYCEKYILNKNLNNNSLDEKLRFKI